MSRTRTAQAEKARIKAESVSGDSRKSCSWGRLTMMTLRACVQGVPRKRCALIRSKILIQSVWLVLHTGVFIEVAHVLSCAGIALAVKGPSDSVLMTERMRAIPTFWRLSRGSVDDRHRALHEKAHSSGVACDAAALCRWQDFSRCCPCDT